ncbi:MAG: serine/threonine-protein phosphatase, partial [Acidobacteria bacterium]|nr:serine/threonine-protein phosphatase [Acidobacteriota bacterium]
MTESPNIILDFFARTDVGVVRNGNEDNFLVLDLSTGGCITAMDEEPPAVLNTALGQYGVLLAVSDGMGGALAGEVASRMAVETVRDLMLRLQTHPVHGLLPFSERLRVAIEQANEVIHRESLSNPLHKGLGATFTAVASSGAEAYFAQVGDSRAYLIRRGRISRITKDQSLVQQLIDNGQITEEEAETHSYRNVILQALGAHPSVRVEMNTLNLCHHDLLVVCSDGLSGKISEQEILQIVGDTPDLQTSCKLLVDLANERGGEDNITVVIARFASRNLPAARVGEVLPQGLARSAATPTVLNWAETSYIEPGGPLS